MFGNSSQPAGESCIRQNIGFAALFENKITMNLLFLAVFNNLIFFIFYPYMKKRYFGLVRTFFAVDRICT